MPMGKRNLHVCYCCFLGSFFDILWKEHGKAFPAFYDSDTGAWNHVPLEDAVWHIILQFSTRYAALVPKTPMWRRMRPTIEFIAIATQYLSHNRHHIQIVPLSGGSYIVLRFCKYCNYAMQSTRDVYHVHEDGRWSCHACFLSQSLWEFEATGALHPDTCKIVSNYWIDQTGGKQLHDASLETRMRAFSDALVQLCELCAEWGRRVWPRIAKAHPPFALSGGYTLHLDSNQVIRFQRDGDPFALCMQIDATTNATQFACTNGTLAQCQEALSCVLFYDDAAGLHGIGE